MFSYSVLRDEESETESETESGTCFDGTFVEEVLDVPTEEDDDAVYFVPYKKVNDHTHSMRGKETIQRHSERLVVYNNSKVALFWGKCFLCLCVGHSQRYCPLKYCSKCNTYGHSVITCANPKNNTIRKQLNLTTGPKFHPSITSKNWRKGGCKQQQKYRSKHVQYQQCLRQPECQRQPECLRQPECQRQPECLPECQRQPECQPEEEGCQSKCQPEEEGCQQIRLPPQVNESTNNDATTAVHASGPDHDCRREGALC